MRPLKTGGGFPAIWYTLGKAREVGAWNLWKAMRSKNACKTCALGMGGQSGGMVNEQGHFPEVCKKSLQAMVADMQGAIGNDFWQTYSLDQLRTLTPRDLETCGRITTPLLLERGGTHYRPITWDNALGRIVSELHGIDPNQSFWYVSGRSSNEAAFLLQLAARLYGTNHISNCSYYCHQASGVGLNAALGTGTATVVLDDVARADLVFLIGANPASNHPRLMRTLMEVRRRGGDVIVINPVIETGLINFSVPSDVKSLLFGTKIASYYLQPHIGGDLALLTALGKRLIELGAVDEAFLNAHCEGWPELAASLKSADWDELERLSGISREELEPIAQRYAKSTNTVFAWTMGITHHLHGVENVQAITNVALMRGMVGRKHAGVLPIRGHSNVQGIGSVGVAPALKPALKQRLESYFNVELPTTPGFDTMGAVEAAAAGHFKVGICLGGNLFGATPDARFTADALSRLNLLVYLNTTLNTGHVHGLGQETLILPVLARDEESQSTTQESMFNYVRLSDGGPARHEGPRSEADVITFLAHSLVGPRGNVDWAQLGRHDAVRKAIAEIVPGFEPIRDIGQTKQEFQIPGRTLHEPRFPTADGRARLFVHRFPESSTDENELRLMTVRSEGQFNTVVYEDYDLYRGQERRDVILINPSDVQRLGLQLDQRVTVQSRVGRLENILVRPYEAIRAGNALMYYPEANVLVPRDVDPQSRTPAFKSVAVRLIPQIELEIIAPAAGVPVFAGDGARLEPATAERSRPQAC